MSRDSLKRVGDSPVRPRIEERPCSGCGKPVEVTVLWRETKSADGYPVSVSGPSMPATCDDCQAAEAETFAAPTKDAETQMLDYLLELGVNTRKHGRSTLKNFDAADSPMAVEALRVFIRETATAGRHDRVKGLFLVGPTGTGKSHLGVAALRAVHEAAPRLRLMYEPADRLIARVQDSYGTGATDALIELRATTHLYVLDDLGREKPTADALRTLCTVLDEREGAPTIITANDTPERLGERFGDRELWGRLQSRLGTGVYRYVGVDGRDRRFLEAIA